MRQAEIPANIARRSDILQAGVVNPGDLAFSFQATPVSGAAINITIAPGTVWTIDANGLAVRRDLPAAVNQTLNLPATPASGSSQLYQIWIDQNGTIGITAGGTAVGNVGVLSLGVAGGPAGSTHLADVAIYNNAGTYQLAVSTSSSQNNNWADGRHWARGAFYYKLYQIAASTSSSGANIIDGSLTNGLYPRINCGSNPMRMTVGARWTFPAGGGFLFPMIDGGGGMQAGGQEAFDGWRQFEWIITPGNGIHRIGPGWLVNTNGNAMNYDSSRGIAFTLEEIMRPNTSN